MGMGIEMDELIKKRDSLLLTIDELEREIANQIYTDEDLEERDGEKWTIPPDCVPINADVLTFDFASLGKSVSFDVIMMDPPWYLATNSCTRGVHISYSSLSDSEILAIPLHQLQQNGFLFLWTINNKYTKAIEMMQAWGYEFIDEIVWVKSTVNRRLAKGHGYFLQHAKESCLVGKKGQLRMGSGANEDDDSSGGGYCTSVGTDVIVTERRGQSQKPEEIYELVEKLVPSRKYLEIFGRRNNLRNGWITIGNEL